MSQEVALWVCYEKNVWRKTQYKVSFEDLKSLLEAKGILKPILEILDSNKVDRVESGGEKTGQGINEETEQGKGIGNF